MTQQQISKNSYLLNLIGTLLSGTCMLGISLMINNQVKINETLSDLKAWKAETEQRSKTNEEKITLHRSEFILLNNDHLELKEEVHELEAMLPEKYKKRKY